MKLFILKKTVKEGVSQRTGNAYKISSLFVKFDEKEIYRQVSEVFEQQYQIKCENERG